MLILNPYNYKYDCSYGRKKILPFKYFKDYSYCINSILGSTVNDYKFREPFELAIKHGHPEVVKVIIDKTGGKSSSNISTHTIHLAAKCGHLNIFKIILDINDFTNHSLLDDRNRTPIHIAAAHGCVGIMEELVARGENPNALSNCRSTPLHYAAQRGHINAVRFLLRCSEGTSPNKKDVTREKPLNLAVKSGHTEIVKTLLNYTKNPIAPDSFGW